MRKPVLKTPTMPSRETLAARGRTALIGVAVVAVLAAATTSCSQSNEASADTFMAGRSDGLAAAPAMEEAMPVSGGSSVDVLKKIDADRSQANGAAAGELAADEPATTVPGGGFGVGSRSDASGIGTERKIIATADLSIRTKDVLSSAARVRSLVASSRGYVESEQTGQIPEAEDGKPAPQGTVAMRLRVPTSSFDTVLKGLAGLGVVVSRNQGAEDVTAEVVDVDSRVISAKASIARMQVLYDKAVSIADVAAIEGELSRRQADLESLLSRQKQLANLTSLATLSVTLFAGDPPVIHEPSTLRAAFDDAATALGRGASAILVGAAAILPFAVLAVLLWFPLRAVLRARRRRSGATPPAPVSHLE